MGVENPRILDTNFLLSGFDVPLTFFAEACRYLKNPVQAGVEVGATGRKEFLLYVGM
jgi:hypothetical protein